MDKERKRLQEARKRIEEQRQALLHAQTPPGKTLFPFDRDLYFVNDIPYHHFSGRERRIKDSVALSSVLSELTLCNICKSPTPIEYEKCVKCDKIVYVTGKLPRCNYCKYLIPNERKVYNDSAVTYACCKSPILKGDNFEAEMGSEERMRLCDSCSPVTSFEIPKDEKWKFKVKFVPVPYEEQPLWVKYQQQIQEESEEEVDEAVKAFQSFTERKKVKSKPKKMAVKYVPHFVSDYVTYPGKRRKTVHFDPVNYTFPRSKSLHEQFQDRMKFTVMHENYHQPELREIANYKKSKLHTKLTETMNDMKVNVIGGFIEQPRPANKLRLKVKYRAMPAFPESKHHK